MMRRRTLLYVLLALAVPLPALALTGGSSAPAPDLRVSASLDSCGTAADQIVCKIDASWNSLPGATRYTARVTSPDGSVTDYGDVGPGGTSFWVPYVGNGTYTVTVAVYGAKPASGEPELLAKSSSGAGGKAGGRHASSLAGGAASSEGAPDDAGGVGDDPGGDQTDPSCEDDTADDEEPPADDDGGVDPAATPQATETESAAAAESSAETEDEPAEADSPDCAVVGATP
jgi:hypothetical protein